MRPRVKKIIIGVLDVVLGAYLVLAVTSFNKPKVVDRYCSKVEITIADSTDAGFLSAPEIKSLLQAKNLYPLGKKMSTINPCRAHFVGHGLPGSCGPGLGQKASPAGLSVGFIVYLPPTG